MEVQSRFELACQAVANAFRWLFALSPPLGAEIGQIEGEYAQTLCADIRAGSGCARHPFFGVDSEAPYRDSGVPALQRHINKV